MTSVFFLSIKQTNKNLQSFKIWVFRCTENFDSDLFDYQSDEFFFEIWNTFFFFRETINSFAIFIVDFYNDHIEYEHGDIDNSLDRSWSVRKSLSLSEDKFL